MKFDLWPGSLYVLDIVTFIRYLKCEVTGRTYNGTTTPLSIKLFSNWAKYSAFSIGFCRYSLSVKVGFIVLEISFYCLCAYQLGQLRAYPSLAITSN